MRVLNKKQKDMFGHYKQQIDNMMQREINRGEFLKFLGIAMLGLFGVTGFIKNLHETIPAHSSAKKQYMASGYGQSPYGR
jgi:hypothetical protein